MTYTVWVNSLLLLFVFGFDCGLLNFVVELEPWFPKLSCELTTVNKMKLTRIEFMVNLIFWLFQVQSSSKFYSNFCSFKEFPSWEFPVCVVFCYVQKPVSRVLWLYNSLVCYKHQLVDGFHFLTVVFSLAFYKNEIAIADANKCNKYTYFYLQNCFMEHWSV